MSELQKLAANVKALSTKAPSYMRGVQEASRSLRSAIQLAASTPRGRQKLAGMLQSNGSSLEKIMSSIGAFSAGASDFAAYLASGQGAGGSTSGESTVMVGDHGALVETSPGGNTTITRVDPETGNEITWVINSQGTTIAAYGILHGRSSEGRTANESATTIKVGQSTRTTHNDYTLGKDDGGHIICSNIAGSNGIINIVPQNSNFNRGAYRQMEKGIADDLDAGSQIKFRIDLSYGSSDSHRPDAFSVVLEIMRPNGQLDFKSFDFYNVIGG